MNKKLVFTVKDQVSACMPVYTGRRVDLALFCIFGTNGQFQGYCLYIQAKPLKLAIFGQISGFRPNLA